MSMTSSVRVEWIAAVTIAAGTVAIGYLAYRRFYVKDHRNKSMVNPHIQKDHPKEAWLDSTSPCSLVWKSRERAHVDSSWSGPESREAGRRGVLPCTSKQSVVTALRSSAAHPVTRNTEIKEPKASPLHLAVLNNLVTVVNSMTLIS
ncbi:hypothetical protein R6Z07M_007992 [Ovis aries]